MFVRIDKFQKNMESRTKRLGEGWIMSTKTTTAPTMTPEPITAVKVCINRSSWPKKSSSVLVIVITNINSVKAAFKELIVQLIRKLKVEVSVRRKKDLGKICGPCFNMQMSQKALIRLLIFLKLQLMQVT